MSLVRRALVGATGLAAVLATTAAVAPASVGATATTTTWVPMPMCAQPAAGQKSCLGVRLVKKQVSVDTTSGMRADVVRRAISRSQLGGPAGGYTPMDLDTAREVKVTRLLG